MTAEDIATARWLISRVIRRWPLNAPETKDLTRALALLSNNPPPRGENESEMHAAHDGENANDSDVARGACDGAQP